MPLAKNIGYIPSNIEFFDKNFETIRNYFDFIELRVSSLAIQNFIGTTVRNINSKSLSDFCNNGGFFNIHFACFSDLNNANSYESMYDYLKSDFINDFVQTPLLFKDNCQNIILPVYMDPFSPNNEVHQQPAINFLNELPELPDYPEDISKMFLLEFRIGNKMPEVQKHLEAIKHFKSDLKEQNGNTISLCIDFSHWHQKLGNSRFLDFLKCIRKSGIKIQEFHIADYKTKKGDKISENLPIGSGMIAWSQFLRFFRDSNLTLAINGGMSSVQRSLSHLGNLSIKKKKRVAGNSVVTGFYFSMAKNSFFQASPGTKLAYKYLMKKNIGIKTVLDLGCGNGRNSFFFSKNFDTTAHLIDIDRDLLNYVKELFLVFNANSPKIDVVDLEKLDDTFFRKKYDVIMLSYVLQNIRPEYYFAIMNFFREITKSIFVFEIYINKQVYPEGVVTKRGENYWYAFSQEEIFELFEAFFDVKDWHTKKGKKTPLMVSLIGTPKRNVTYEETLFDRYQNMPIVNYSPPQLKSKDQKNVSEKATKKRKRQS